MSITEVEEVHVEVVADQGMVDHAGDQACGAQGAGVCVCVCV